MRSLTPNFRKNVFRAFGAKSHTPGKVDFCRCLYPISKAGWTSPQKVPLGVRLTSTRSSHRRTGGFVEVYTHRKPGKVSTGGAFQKKTDLGQRCPNADPCADRNARFFANQNPRRVTWRVSYCQGARKKGRALRETSLACLDRTAHLSSPWIRPKPTTGKSPLRHASEGAVRSATPRSSGTSAPLDGGIEQTADRTGRGLGRPRCPRSSRREFRLFGRDPSVGRSVGRVRRPSF